MRANLGLVRVHDPIGDSYFDVPALDQGYAKGLSIWQHRLIVRFENRRMDGAADWAGIAKAKVEIAAMFEAAWHGRKLKSRARAARHDGVGRHALAGANEVTSPEGSVNAARRASAKLATGRFTPKPSPAPKPLGKDIGVKRLMQLSPRMEGIEDEEDIYARLGLRQ